jgi:hypothetical protein
MQHQPALPVEMGITTGFSVTALRDRGVELSKTAQFIPGMRTRLAADGQPNMPRLSVSRWILGDRRMREVLSTVELAHFAHL